MTRCSQNKISAYHVHNSENIIMRLSGSRDPDETLKMTYGGSRRRSERTISLIFWEIRAIYRKEQNEVSKNGVFQPHYNFEYNIYLSKLNFPHILSQLRRVVVSVNTQKAMT